MEYAESGDLKTFIKHRIKEFSHIEENQVKNFYNYL